MPQGLTFVETSLPLYFPSVANIRASIGAISRSVIFSSANALLSGGLLYREPRLMMEKVSL
jgi:hypothetical protein